MVLAKEESSLVWTICKSAVQRSFDCPVKVFSTGRRLSFWVLLPKASSIWGANRANSAGVTFWVRLIRHSEPNGSVKMPISDPLN
jgi:hypothetical protein